MTDIHETFDYGYDTSVEEAVPLEAPTKPATVLLSSNNVDRTYLPLVVKRNTPAEHAIVLYVIHISCGHRLHRQTFDSSSPIRIESRTVSQNR